MNRTHLFGTISVGLAALFAGEARAQQAQFIGQMAANATYIAATVAPEDDPNSTVDSDGDGFTDYEEKHNPLFNHPQADFHTPGVFAADIHKPDIFLEVAHMGHKTASVPYFWTPWHGWYYTTIVVEGAHTLSNDDTNDMIARFAEHGWNVHIVVGDEFPHEDTIGYDRWSQLVAAHRHIPAYYFMILAHKSDGHMAGSNGVTIGDHQVIFDGELAIKLFQGPDVMHELGHSLIGSYWNNPKAHHLLDKPDVWNDGIHCPYDCCMNYASKLGIGGLISQWWEFNYDYRCWGALRGRYGNIR
jgi:hypothetical protein